MKIKLFIAASDGQDGSFSVKLFNTKEEALGNLKRTEEELQNGTFYDDGALEEIELELDEEGKLKESVWFSVGQ